MKGQSSPGCKIMESARFLFNVSTELQQAPIIRIYRQHAYRQEKKNYKALFPK